VVRAKKKKTCGKAESGPLGHEARLWQMADALRNNMDAAEYKHVVLGLIFLKYISDAFEGSRRTCVPPKRAARTSGYRTTSSPSTTRSKPTTAPSRCSATRGKRILRKYGYPPDKQEKATETVLEQAEVLSEAWSTA
jgi:hypothetical protein